LAGFDKGKVRLFIGNGTLGNEKCAQNRPFHGLSHRLRRAFGARSARREQWKKSLPPLTSGETISRLI